MMPIKALGNSVELNAADAKEAPIMSRQRTEFVSLRVERFALNDAAGLETCRHCETALELSQPDPLTPARLVGLCRSCGAWYILDDATDGESRSRLELPMGPVGQENTPLTVWMDNGDEPHVQADVG